MSDKLHIVKPPLFWIVLVFLFSASAYAIDENTELPIQIESDTATINDKTGQSVYSGNVIISQGSSRLEADTITVDSQDRKLNSITAKGNPAHFTQQSEESQTTHGYAESIIYTASNASLKLVTEAKLIQGSNSFTGELIEYDIERKAIKAKGNEEKGSRVRIEYFPSERSENASSADDSPSATSPLKADSSATSSIEATSKDKDAPDSKPSMQTLAPANPSQTDAGQTDSQVSPAQVSRTQDNAPIDEPESQIAE